MTEKFANVPMPPDQVSNAQMGLVFEELIRDLLQERRTALISAAVTGQIDLRDAAARSAA